MALETNEAIARSNPLCIDNAFGTLREYFESRIPSGVHLEIRAFLKNAGNYLPVYTVKITVPDPSNPLKEVELTSHDRDIEKAVRSVMEQFTTYPSSRH